MQLNREKLAELLGCSLRTVDEYCRQGMPGKSPERPGGQWRFETSSVIQWLRDRERASAIGEISNIDEKEARRRKLAAEAAMAEFELAVKEGGAVSIKDFSAAWASMIGAARAKLLGLGAGLGPTVALLSEPSQCEAKIEFAVKEALQELSEFEPNLPIDPSGDTESPNGRPGSVEVVGPASGSDGKRVGRRGKTPQP